MIDPVELANDIVANSVSLALPAAVWALLFVLAFEHPAFAESLGLGRTAFWLLFLGSVLATFAILPFGVVSDDIVAVSFGGALFPLLVGAFAVRRVDGGGNRLVGEYLLVLAGAAVVMLFLVLPLAAPLVDPLGSYVPGGPTGATELLLLGVVVVAVLVAAILPRSGARAAPAPPGRIRPLPFLVGLTGAVLLATFAASTAIPGVGIVEQFPFYLLPPIGAGAMAAVLASEVVPGREGFALPLAYFATTFGVLLGADLLHQPPLYGTGPAGLYTIGGAGVLDLVYLSGLLALGTAFVVHRALRRPFAPVGDPWPPPAPSPVGRLGRAFRAGVDGRLADSLRDSARAGHESADQARALLGLPPAPEARPWDGLPVPGWVVSDQANLDAVARAGSTDGREGFRAWLTARWLVYLGRDLGQRRFGSLGARIVGFLLDLVVVTVPAAAVWVAIVLATPGGLDAVLSSLPFNAAIYGFVSFAFLYFVLSETLTGRSLGKRGVGLVVRDRALRPVRFVPALLRNATVLPALTVVGLGGALGVAFLFKLGSVSRVTIDGIPFPGGLLALAGILGFLAVGVGLLGALAILVIALTAERQRLGDLLAGTWVVAEVTPGAAGPASPPPVPPPPGPPPSG